MLKYDRRQIVLLFAFLYLIYFITVEQKPVEDSVQEQLDEINPNIQHQKEHVEEQITSTHDLTPTAKGVAVYSIVELTVENNKTYTGHVGFEVKQWDRKKKSFETTFKDERKLAKIEDFFIALYNVLIELPSVGASMVVDTNGMDYDNMRKRKFDVKQFLTVIEDSMAVNVIGENGGFTRYDLVVDRYRKSHMRFPKTKIAHGYFAGKNTLLLELVNLIVSKSIPLYDDDIVTDIVARSCLSMYQKCRRSRRKPKTWKLGGNNLESLLYPAPLYYVHIPKCGSSFAGVLLHHTCPNTHLSFVKSPYDAKREADFIENCNTNRFLMFSLGHHPLTDRGIAKGHVVSSFRPTADRIVSGYFHNKHDCYSALKHYFPIDRVNSPYDEEVLRQYARLAQHCATKMILGRFCCGRDPVSQDDIEQALRIVENDYAFVFRQDKYTESAHQWETLYGSDFGNLKIEFNTRPSAASQAQIDKAKAVVLDTLDTFTDDHIFELVERKWNAQAERVKLLKKNPELQDFTDLELQVLQGNVKEDEF